MKWKVNIVLNYWKEKTFARIRWMHKIKRGKYSNNKRLGVYVQMIKRSGDKCAINKMLEL